MLRKMQRNGAIEPLSQFKVNTAASSRVNTNLKNQESDENAQIVGGKNEFNFKGKKSITGGKRG